MKFTVSGNPKGKARPRFTRSGRAYNPKDNAIHEAEIAREFVNQGGVRFADDAEIFVRIRAFYSIPKSADKQSKELMQSNTVRPTKKPDIDNVIKLVLDALNGVAYKDDSQVVHIVAEKLWSDTPRIEITIDTEE